MEAFKGAKWGPECNATLNRKTVQFQEHGRDMASFDRINQIGRVSLARENEAGAVGGRKSIFSMLAYRTSFCFWL